jgi:hypothetical protein
MRQFQRGTGRRFGKECPGLPEVFLLKGGGGLLESECLLFGRVACWLG